jgi:uncharacterized phage protein (TIGR01671 family)
MRELKFRAWDKINNTYILHEKQNTLMIPCSLGVLWLNPSIKDNNYVIKKQHFIIEQYTGLKDKNGVEIYEGDIVEINGFFAGNSFGFGDNEEYEYLITGYVIYVPSKGFCLKRFKTWDIDNDIDISSTTTNKYAYITQCASMVIGKIHENPELIK